MFTLLRLVRLPFATVFSLLWAAFWGAFMILVPEDSAFDGMSLRDWVRWLWPERSVGLRLLWCDTPSSMAANHPRNRGPQS